MQIVAIAQFASLLGQSILHYGGYELELEGEYAFSIHSRREDWEEEQALWIA
jgi:hypothetical protein